MPRLRTEAAVVICYCKRDIADGDRHIVVTTTVDWGTDDLRETPPAKTATFHSFDCLASWAHDRALQHDDVVVKEGEAV